MAGDAVLTGEAADELFSKEEVSEPSRVKTIPVSIQIQTTKFGRFVAPGSGLAAYTEIGVYARGFFWRPELDENPEAEVEIRNLLIPYSQISWIEFYDQDNNDTTEQEENGEDTND